MAWILPEAAPRVVFLPDNFPQILRPDFTGSLAARLQQLAELCANQERLAFYRLEFWRTDGYLLRH